MCLRFVYLLITRASWWLRLSRHEESWKTAEILILRHQLTVLQRRQPRRPDLDWADRALLATLLAVIPKARRQVLRLLVTPDTILRWHRDIIRRRWAARSIRGKTGRPATRRNIRVLVLRLARENPDWGYRRIHGELAGLGVKIAASTVWEILKKASIDPTPRRADPTWPQFLRSQAETILACDLFTADLLDGTQAYILAVIEHATRRIRILGVTLHPTGAWTTQQARNLIMDLGDQAHLVKFMIRDRGSNYTAAFDAVLADAGIRTVLCSVRTPRMNAIAERWIGGCRRELLDRTLIWNQDHLRRILRQYETHHNQHRPHRSLDSAAPLKPLPEPVDLERYRVRRRTCAGHLINEYRLIALRGRGFRHSQAGPATCQRIRATLRSAISSYMRQHPGDLPANVASLAELPAAARPKALVWTGERVRAWQEDFDARLAAAQAAGGRVSPVDIWISTPRPSPVMVWTPAQTMVFLDAARRHRLHALWRLITTRGLRRGEGCGLRRPDTDLDAATATVRWQITQLGWDPVQGAPKSDAGERTVALDADTVTDMTRWRQEQDKERKTAGDAWAGSGFEFTDEQGNPLHPATVTGMFQLIAYLAGLPPIRLHDLRHGAATLLLAAGHDLKLVQDTLGLSSITIAADTYTSVLPQLARQSAEDVAALIRPAGQASAPPGRRRAAGKARQPRGTAAPEPRPAGK